MPSTRPPPEPGRGPAKPRSGYLVEVAAGEQHGAAGLRALVVGGLVPLLPHPLGLPLPAPAVAVGAGPAEVVGGQRAGGAPAHPAGARAPRSAPARRGEGLRPRKRRSRPPHSQEEPRHCFIGTTAGDRERRPRRSGAGTQRGVGGD